jgi:hypothetical protein
MGGNSVTDNQQDHSQGDQRTLEQRVKDLEIQNGELLRRLKAVENKAGHLNHRTFHLQKVGLN